MVETRITRQAIEVLADSGQVAGITRVDTEVATEATEAGSEEVQVTRQAVEVAADSGQVAGITRVDTEVATEATEAGSEEVQVTRQAVEVLASPLREGSITRLDTEVAGLATTANAEEVQITRQSIEALARRGSAGPVTPLDLADGIEVFLHNWASDLKLSTSYNTSVKRSPVTGAESRRGLVLKPDRTMRLVWQMDDDERLDRLYVMLRKLTDERLAIPLYCDQRELDAAYTSADDTVFFDTTKGRWAFGARVVIVQFDYAGQYDSHSFHIIDDMEDDRLVFDATLGVNVAAQSIILPMMDCEVELEAEIVHATGKNAKVTLEVSEVQGASALPPVKADFPSDAQVFDDAPIFDIDPDWSQGIKKGRKRAGKSYSQGRGQRVLTEGDRSREMHDIVLVGDREEMWRVIEFFDTRRGMLRSFWFTDFEFIWNTAEIDASGNFIGVSELGDLDDFKAELEGEWIGLVMADGSVYVREVTTVQQVLTVYRCTVTPALPAGLDASDAVRVARARRTRFASDEMDEVWKHTGLMKTRLRFIEVLEEKDVA